MKKSCGSGWNEVRAFVPASRLVYRSQRAAGDAEGVFRELGGMADPASRTVFPVCQQLGLKLVLLCTSTGMYKYWHVQYQSTAQ